MIQSTGQDKAPDTHILSSFKICSSCQEQGDNFHTTIVTSKMERSPTRLRGRERETERESITQIDLIFLTLHRTSILLPAAKRRETISASCPEQAWCRGVRPIFRDRPSERGDRDRETQREIKSNTDDPRLKTHITSRFKRSTICQQDRDSISIISGTSMMERSPVILKKSHKAPPSKSPYH
jgi:hypothetical protein